MSLDVKTTQYNQAIKLHFLATKFSPLFRFHGMDYYLNSRGLPMVSTMDKVLVLPCFRKHSEQCGSVTCETYSWYSDVVLS